MQKLNELDTSQVEPMAQVTYPAAANPSLRADQPHKTFEQEEALGNAPDQNAGCFRVPRVIEKEE
jgi:aspartyl-tRNA(Asn)/glutamyl-tRNA(Gln) amidotransferase subunit C